MAKILPILLVILGLVGGGAAGFFLKPPPPPEETAEEGEAEKDMAEGDPAETMPAKPKPPPPELVDEDGQLAAMPYEYVQLKHQFVVPLVEVDEVASLVVVSLSLEMFAGFTDAVHDREPKLRDLFLRVLFRQSQSGAFTGVFTADHFMQDLRANLLEAARSVLGETVNDVLITEILRKDV